jgi:hypothetical protein
MTERELPIIVTLALLIGVTFTVGVNSMLGGTVQKAQQRAISVEQATPAPSPDASERATPTTRHKKHDSRSRKRHSHRKHAPERRTSRSHSSADQQVAAPAPSTTPTTSVPSSPPVSVPVAKPAPRKAPKPKSGGGQSFYNTG